MGEPRPYIVHWLTILGLLSAARSMPGWPLVPLALTLLAVLVVMHRDRRIYRDGYRQGVIDAALQRQRIAERYGAERCRSVIWRPRPYDWERER